MEKKMFLVRFLPKHLTLEILSYVYVLISLEILTVTSTITTTTKTIIIIFHHHHCRHHRRHNHLEERIFFSQQLLFNLHYKLLDKIIFLAQHHHYHLMIIFFCQTHHFFLSRTQNKSGSTSTKATLSGNKLTGQLERVIEKKSEQRIEVDKDIITRTSLHHLNWNGLERVGKNKN